MSEKCDFSVLYTLLFHRTAIQVPVHFTFHTPTWNITVLSKCLRAGPVYSLYAFSISYCLFPNPVRACHCLLPFGVSSCRILFPCPATGYHALALYATSGHLRHFHQLSCEVAFSIHTEVRHMTAGFHMLLQHITVLLSALSRYITFFQENTSVHHGLFRTAALVKRGLSANSVSASCDVAPCLVRPYRGL